MSHRALPAVLAALALTLTLAGPAHATPASLGHQTAHASLWARALTWLTRLIGPIQLATDPDKGGMIDPNGGH